MARLLGWVYSEGTEPDARFSLANERTFLAWIRTSLALMASGVALRAFDVGGGAIATHVASILLVVLSIWMPLQAWWNWAGTERDLRLRRPLRSPRGSFVLASVLTVVGLLVTWELMV
ncbi:YidH family protein [Williamsia sp. SKLECPSW1]